MACRSKWLCNFVQNGVRLSYLLHSFHALGMLYPVYMKYYSTLRERPFLLHAVKILPQLHLCKLVATVQSRPSVQLMTVRWRTFLWWNRRPGADCTHDCTLHNFGPLDLTHLAIIALLVHSWYWSMFPDYSTITRYDCSSRADVSTQTFVVDDALIHRDHVMWLVWQSRCSSTNFRGQ